MCLFLLLYLFHASDPAIIHLASSKLFVITGKVGNDLLNHKPTLIITKPILQLLEKNHLISCVVKSLLFFNRDNKWSLQTFFPGHWQLEYVLYSSCLNCELRHCSWYIFQAQGYAHSSRKQQQIHFGFYLTLCSKKVLAFVNDLLCPFEQLGVDYADRYKADDTHNFPPIISKPPPKPRRDCPEWEPDLAQLWAHSSTCSRRNRDKKRSQALTPSFQGNASFSREPHVNLRHCLCASAFVTRDELLVLALKCTQNLSVAETSPSKETARKKHDRYLDQV